MGTRGHWQRLRIYERHTQADAIRFIDYVVSKFPFRIHTVRTDRGHELQALLHWHVADRGMQHVYIKPRSPQLNGKVERSHPTDKDECYQLLEYRGDVDPNSKLAEWERFYNTGRPHTAFGGNTPYEVLRDRPKLIHTSERVVPITLRRRRPVPLFHGTVPWELSADSARQPFHAQVFGMMTFPPTLRVASVLAGIGTPAAKPACIAQPSN